MDTTSLAYAIDTIWVLLAAFLVFFMQPGFALVEAGFTQSKNAVNILMKNFADFMIASLVFFAVGYGFMFGVGNGFIGMDNFFLSNLENNGIPALAFFLFQTVFAGTTATIVSGAMAELVYRFLTAIADEHHSFYRLGTGFTHGVGQHPADLGAAAQARHTVHQAEQLAGFGDKTGCLELTKTTVITQLDSQATQIFGGQK